ncbi:hypothetical protein, partial [Pseudomonas avellanae]|uniref:hypothetical protein n=1 Tax=Pseudomonas avellanae TaxID=46257 RepID=UPI001CA4BF9F
EVHFFDFGVGSHHGELAPEKNREHSIKLQLPAWNVGFMRRLRNTRDLRHASAAPARLANTRLNHLFKHSSHSVWRQE